MYLDFSKICGKKFKNFCYLVKMFHIPRWGKSDDFVVSFLYFLICFTLIHFLETKILRMCAHQVTWALARIFNPRSGPEPAVVWVGMVLMESARKMRDLSKILVMLYSNPNDDRPFNYMDTFTPFSLFWGHVFFAFQHNFGTFCRGELLKLVWISVAKIWSRSLILLFPQENHTFGISGINLCHLGAELSILRCRKRFRIFEFPALWCHRYKTKINTAVRWSNLVCIERGEPQLSIYSMKKSLALQPRDLCRLKKIGLGCQIFPLWELFKLWLHKNYCCHKNQLTCNGYRKIWWISTENFGVRSLLFLVFCRGPPKRVQFAYLGPTADIREKMVGAESVNT
jgi:hypothetical protein